MPREPPTRAARDGAVGWARIPTRTGRLYRCVPRVPRGKRLREGQGPAARRAARASVGADSAMSSRRACGAGRAWLLCAPACACGRARRAAWVCRAPASPVHGRAREGAKRHESNRSAHSAGHRLQRLRSALRGLSCAVGAEALDRQRRDAAHLERDQGGRGSVPAAAEPHDPRCSRPSSRCCSSSATASSAGTATSIRSAARMQLAFWITLSFVFGALCSVFAGYIGMWVSIRSQHPHRARRAHEHQRRAAASRCAAARSRACSSSR